MALRHIKGSNIRLGDWLVSGTAVNPRDHEGKVVSVSLLGHTATMGRIWDVTTTTTKRGDAHFQVYDDDALTVDRT